ncbi:MAG: acetyl-CoA carboxylase biotin carboxylase subunit [Chloroflexi bacterium]|nr:acetyl-CoA carboxylase biotin carboxylase subunit [Chloroflexota bacterium]
MIRKLLIANRGEIALRILRACRELGIATVAVYSEADRTSLHVRFADEAYPIGPPPARESYLKVPALLEVARRSGADALHPGYGFLAENADFAEACLAAGLTFVGPSPAAIRAMGDKIQARRLAQQAGLPLVPGTLDEVADIGSALATAEAIGFPVLLKASGGGGGRGIRLVTQAEDMAAAFSSATSEAAAGFGHGGVYLEKYLAPIRHVEVQVMADRFGRVVALGERECSIQRRHQKIIEEAPSPAVSPALRSRLMEMAAAVARAVQYEGAGTVEFLLDGEGQAYFMEMNTRLQVEHPVTEMVTGTDLVADQLLVASGEPLGYTQDDVQLRGWAIECRITSEDPYHDFVPSVGVVRLFHEPGGPGIRVDTGLYDHMEVTVYYDPLLAKLIAWGRDREQAMQRMRRALREVHITGIHTNIPFHLYVLESPEFQQGQVDTGFAERALRAWQRQEGEQVDVALLAAALVAYHERRTGTERPGGAPGGAHRGRCVNPWTLTYRPGPTAWTRR